jgi:TolB-like protein/DNA-binding winged helix-turn-helix (wHTH) protein/Tfp pilus assembly protein PilF
MEARDRVQAPIFRFGPFTADLRSGELHKQGTRIRLQEQPFRVLAILLERPGDLITREELRARLWPSDTFVDFDHGLHAAINRLRERLGDSAGQPKYIETVPRRGYRFLAQVEVVNHSNEPRTELTSVAPPAPGRLRPWIRPAAAVVLLAAVLASFIGVRSSRKAPRSARPVQAIAVLPFANYSGDPSQDYFADGITEALTTELSEIKAWKVISRTSAMRYRGSSRSVPEIAHELGVDAIVEGSVIREADQVRVTVQLIDAASDHHLWSDHYQREAHLLLALEAEIAQAIAREIRIAVTPVERARLAASRTVDPKAYDAYLRGRYYWNRWDRGLDQATPAFEQATQLDPTFAPAFANLALCYSTLGFFERPRDVFPKAKAAALKALELDPGLPEAHAAAGNISLSYDWDLQAADREWRRAVELNPNSVEAHLLAAYYMITTGHFDEAIKQEKRAIELDPLSPNVVSELGWMYLNLGHYDEALAQYNHAIELEPNHEIAREQIVWIYIFTGRYAEAHAEYKKKRRANSPWLGYLYGVTGKRAEALRVAQALEEASKKEYVDPYVIAIVYAGIGDKDRAFAWLNKAYEERSTFLNHLHVENFFDSLRSDKRFSALSRRIGLPIVDVSQIRPATDH